VVLQPLLEAAIMRALAKDPQERFQKIEELAAEVRAASPRFTRPPPTTEPVPGQATATLSGVGAGLQQGFGAGTATRRPLEDPTSRIVERITREFQIEEIGKPGPRWPRVAGIAGAVAVIVVLGYALLR
jgi:hypothetical protein